MQIKHEWVKQKLETAIDAFQEIVNSGEYRTLKALIATQTGGLELEDVLRDANCFSKGVDDLDAIASADEEINRDDVEREESLRYWESMDD